MIVSIGIAIAHQLSAEPRKSASKSTPIHLAELHERGLEGRLGFPLGTIVEVSGVVVENNSKSKTHAAEPFFLQIEKVKNQTLQRPQTFSLTETPIVRKYGKMKIGDRFNCIGYESGAFVGSPDGEFDYVPAYSTQPFHFASEFIVLKVL